MKEEEEVELVVFNKTLLEFSQPLVRLSQSLSLSRFVFVSLARFALGCALGCGLSIVQWLVLRRLPGARLAVPLWPVRACLSAELREEKKEQNN